MEIPARSRERLGSSTVGKGREGSVKIRVEQMAALEQDFRHRWRLSLIPSLRGCLPLWTDPLDDATMVRRIAEADEKAQSYGIVTEKGISQFVGLSFLAGADFDERPNTKRFLRDPRIDPHHKIDVLVDYLAECGSDSGGDRP
jgi:hypothetical protein